MEVSCFSNVKQNLIMLLAVCYRLSGANYIMLLAACYHLSGAIECTYNYVRELPGYDDMLVPLACLPVRGTHGLALKLCVRSHA